MGDPECQVILPLLKTDIVKIFKNAISNKLKNMKIEWLKKKCMTIVLCAKGYPGNYRKNLKINNIDKIKITNNDFLFHAGSKKINNKIVSTGGRILNFVSTGQSYIKIRKKIISNIKKIKLKNSFFRNDIGWKIVKNENN